MRVLALVAAVPVALIAASPAAAAPRSSPHTCVATVTASSCQSPGSNAAVELIPAGGHPCAIRTLPAGCR
ncbi:hypothetical protein [Mycobacterium sp. Root265]|uniref:hypothetical protein n=1 Tax=Mycobacterium sp. Root265 TaxID=1736504 RepID=UPI0012E3C71F|nr:hypothetical protein [Mycobacterium sp. Root265]